MVRSANKHCFAVVRSRVSVKVLGMLSEPRMGKPSQGNNSAHDSSGGGGRSNRQYLFIVLRTAVFSQCSTGCFLCK